MASAVGMTLASHAASPPPSAAAAAGATVEQVTRALEVLFHGSEPHQQMQAHAWLLHVMNTHESHALHTHNHAARSAPSHRC